ncbi:hypothetical protein SAMN04489761_4641 [Tenacibaculum sp. MAR_2009_124]|uniref:hypothetical protein n=1 Tax=Tenacibaculum sp. MAR_2009_124 TaxID=1250059 RepID=UPI00089CD2AD|nr:hypothetical protein [Tenacibaculum sp. MAR_2009_124]SED21267.1 hypothetical protein SAMN04489761_4641 [Tenacibaculum sp. MAR_2009_124]
MIGWFKKILKRKDYIGKSLRKSLKSDDNASTDKIVEKMKRESDHKDEIIHNLLVDIMLLENDINSEV